MRTRWDMLLARLILAGAVLIDGAVGWWAYYHWPEIVAGGLFMFGFVAFTLAGLAAFVVAVPFVPQSGILFEWLARKRFKDVCLSVGLGRMETKEWENMKGGKSSLKISRWPRLYSVAGVADNWSADIGLMAGQSLDDFKKHADRFAVMFGTAYVRFEIVGRGLVRMTAASVTVPETVNYPVNAFLPDRAHPVQSLLVSVPVATRLDGSVYSLPLEGSHVLIAGRTGSGKSGWIWSVVMSIAPAVISGYVRLWGLDPKKIELAIGREWWHEYADNTVSIVELLEKAAAEVDQRHKDLQGIARKYTASRQTPLNLIVIDELGQLMSTTDKKLKERLDRALNTVLYLGRAAGYVVVGAVQDPRKETIPNRDLMPVRVALGLDAAMTELVLGKEAREAGAYCDMIPMGEAGAGTAYVLGEHDKKPVMVRAFWCDDRVIREYGADVARSLETIQQEASRRSAFSVVQPVLQ